MISKKEMLERIRNRHLKPVISDEELDKTGVPQAPADDPIFHMGTYVTRMLKPPATPKPSGKPSNRKPKSQSSE